MTEAAIVTACERELRSRPDLWWANLHSTGYGRNGLPDLIAIHRGQVYLLEVKQPGRTPTRLQAHELARGRVAGAITAVITSRRQLAALLDQHP